MLKKKGLIPITKANKKEHIKLNLEALDFVMDKEDYKKLNDVIYDEYIKE